jgi:TonB family protein
MLPSLLFPAVAKASTPMDDASAPTPVRVSTGVNAPVLIESPSVVVLDSFTFDAIPNDAQVLLTLTVDEKGQPQDIHIVKSYNPLWNAQVLDAVRNFRYKPGTIDNQPTPVDVDLTVNITR